MKHPPTQALGPGVNRIGDVLMHVQRYQCHRVVRLAEDTGVSHTAISRLLSGRRQPTVKLLNRVAEAIERELGYRIDPRELYSENGRFPTRYACDLIRGCRGCLPNSATDEDGNRRRAFEGIRPGQWVSSRYPRGYELSVTGGNHEE